VSDDEDAKKRRLRDRIIQAFSAAVPHNRALGISMVEWGDGFAKHRLPYDEKLIGNPETGVLHGGAITALLDACCGTAVFNSLPEPQPIATLDLRIDYLGPATPGRDVFARADCYKVTRHVAFVRATAFHEGDEAAPIASASGTFMVTQQKTRAAP